MRKKIKVNQFHPGAAVGDAITDMMLAIRSLLREYGYDSEIYCQQVPNELIDEIKNIDSYKGSGNSVLLVHHSMGFDGIDKIIKLPDKEILIYHNITPERFLEDEFTKKYARLGLAQLQAYFERVEHVIAVSNYNRRDLLRLGCKNTIDVMPVQINVNRLDSVQADAGVLNSLRETKNILFVGRLTENKCQEDVLRAFAVYHNNYNRNSRLFLVGDDSRSFYVDKLRTEMQSLGLGGAVCFTGKVSVQKLKAYYQSADLFLCMSEHEGFGVPLIEAMQNNVPVIAYRSSAVPETMDGAGVLVSEKNYDYLGALIDEILQDASLRDGLVAVQHKRMERLQKSRTDKVLFRAIDDCLNQKRRKKVQIQGHMEGSYSLAAVNRDLSEALLGRNFADVSICSTDGEPGRKLDFGLFSDKVKAMQMWKQAEAMPFPDVVIRNAYPPSTKGMKGGLNLYSWAWEESRIPPSFIDGFNRDLQGIGTTSQYVTEKLLENGIKIPVRTIGNGVKLPQNYAGLQPYPLKTQKRIKFLHISSAFPRKGVDVLLRGYYQAFDRHDDVCLVLKTFPNPHNNVAEIIENLNKDFKEPPAVEWIDQDLSQESLYGLYKAVDCYVSMARGEGFGLPVAEAMLAKLPVIVAANSGVLDFCNRETAFLVSCEMTEARTHFSDGYGEKKSYWYEPKIDELVTHLENFASGKYERLIGDKTKKAYNLISTKFTWSAVAERWENFIEDLEANQYRPKVGMVTTWNSKCGIAEYTRMMVEASEQLVDYHIFANKGVELIKDDESYVERTWQIHNRDVSGFISAVLKSDCEIVNFQYSNGFMNEQVLGETIEALSAAKKVIVTFHETKVLGMSENFVHALNKCSALVMHQAEDMERMRSSGVRESLLHLIPLGQVVVPEVPVQEGRKKLGLEDRWPIIGSYGFLFSHKGVKETILAMPHILKKYPNAIYMPVCALYPAPVSKEYLDECQAVADRLGVSGHVKFVTDFLSNDEALKHLQCCDIISFAYSYTEQSASGAVRFGFAAGRPVITTKQKIFAEFQDFAHQIKSNSPGDIAEGVLELLDERNKDKVNEALSRQKAYIYQQSWQETAGRWHSLYEQLSQRGRVVQLVPVLSYGDAIGNEIVSFYKLLEEMGISTCIYADGIDERIAAMGVDARNYRELTALNRHDVLIYHYAMSWGPVAEMLDKLICRKVMVYHNVTPSKFFEKFDQNIRHSTAQDLRQLQKDMNKYDFCLADSDFNKRDLESLGCQVPICSIPLLVDLKDYEQEPAKEVIDRYDDGAVNLLFVGRIVPNKCQHDVIKLYAAYRNKYGGKVRLFLVGSTTDKEYEKYVHETAVSTGYQDDIIFTGHIPFAHILAYYRLADLFLCMSEHEGFCVPLLEAMKLQVPIIAYDACAVPETMGRAGVVVKKKDFELIAESMHELLEDEAARKKMVIEQERRLKNFAYAKVSRDYQKFFEQLLS